MAKSTSGDARRAHKRTKSYRLEQRKIDRAKRILGVATETEAIEQALDLVAIGHTLASRTRRLEVSTLDRARGDGTRCMAWRAGKVR